MSADKELDAVPKYGMMMLSINTDCLHELKLIFDIKPEMKEVEIDGVKRIGIINGCILLAAESDDDPDAIKICKDAQIEKKEGFHFEVGGVSYTDYASAGRKHNFIIWARENNPDAISV